MPLFLSSYANRVDKKGRVSVPAPFRAELEHLNGFVAFPHTEHACIEGWDRGRMAQLAQAMDDYSPLSEEYDALGYLLGRARELPFDPEGRVILPAYLMESAEITDSVLFIGRGNSFQIWNPEKHAQFEARIKPSSAIVAKAISLGRARRGGPHE
ncbi:division/cell wall cluster transcriptional repressor MraZ [Emcibacter sp. SYSU 3D8]|uniref:division/cell wall cluster transcriptional repressor MraZ n=1 Tax=Emcibacter sp. SYSU 3D8 TaxID=3133969 RepID=UPI0031FF0E96